LDAFLDSVKSDIAQTPAFKQMLQAAQTVFAVIGAIKDAVQDIRDGKVHDALGELDALAGFIFGAGSGPFAKIDASLSKGFSALQSDAKSTLTDIVAVPNGDAVFAAEVLACKTYDDLVEKKTA